MCMWNHLIVLIMISITPSFKVQTIFEQSKELVRQWRKQHLNVIIVFVPQAMRGNSLLKEKSRVKINIVLVNHKNTIKF